MQDRAYLRRPTQSTEPPSASYRDSINQSEGDQASALCQEYMGEVTSPAQRQDAAGTGNRKARQIARERPRQPTCALGSEVQGKRKPEHPVGGSHHAQVARSGIEHGGVCVEKREPGIGKDRGAEADSLGQGGRDAGPDPRNAQGAVALSRSDVSADHRNQRRAQSEGEGYEKVFQPRARPVTRDRSRSEPSDQRRADHDGEIRRKADEAGHRTDAQNVAEE